MELQRFNTPIKLFKCGCCFNSQASLFFRYLLILWLSLSNLKQSDCVVLPSMLWDALNPIFNETKCGKSNALQARVNDVLHFVCPSRASNTGVIPSIRNFDDMYENLWFTEDEEAVRNCDTSSAYHLFDCNKPNELMYYGCSIRQRMSRISFLPGRKYYFFGTGDGSKPGLAIKKGGHCRTHNLVVSVYVCQSHEVCNRTETYSCGKKTEVRYVRVTGPSQRSGQNMMSNLGDGLIWLCFITFFVLGLAVGMVLKIAYQKVQRTYFKPSKPCCPESPAKSLYTETETNGNCRLTDTTFVLENEVEDSHTLRL